MGRSILEDAASRFKLACDYWTTYVRVLTKTRDKDLTRAWTKTRDETRMLTKPDRKGTKRLTVTPGFSSVDVGWSSYADRN